MPLCCRRVFLTISFTVDSLETPKEWRSYKYMHHALFVPWVLKCFPSKLKLFFFLWWLKTLYTLARSLWSSLERRHRFVRFVVKSNSHWCTFTFTESSGPALVGVVRKDWASPNSIALSWSQVEQPPSDILDYEVKYYERVCTICVALLSGYSASE